MDYISGMSDRLALAKADLAAVRSDIAALRSDIRDAVHHLTIRGFAALVSGLGALFAALHYWPPHG